MGDGRQKGEKKGEKKRVKERHADGTNEQTLASSRIRTLSLEDELAATLQDSFDTATDDLDLTIEGDAVFFDEGPDASPRGVLSANTQHADDGAAEEQDRGQVEDGNLDAVEVQADEEEQDSDNADDEFHDAQSELSSPLAVTAQRKAGDGEQASSSEKVEVGKARAADNLPGADGNGISNDTVVSDASNTAQDGGEEAEEENEEDSGEMSEEEWVQKEKHIIILSDAGKPIFTRHGGEGAIVTRTGVIQALISFVEESQWTDPTGKHSSQDELKWFKAGRFQYVFLIRKPLYLLSISQTEEPPELLHQQLEHVFNQILSVTTLSHITQVFRRQASYDLRRQIAGMEKFSEHLIDSLDREYGFFLNSINCLPLSQLARDKMGQLIQTHRHKDLAFAAIIANGQLVTLVRPKKYNLFPQDILLLLNFVQTPTQSFDAGSTWVPFCLPKFNSNGFLHCHMSYLDANRTICMLLLTTNPNAFYHLNRAQANIKAALEEAKLIEKVVDACRRPHIPVGRIGVPILRFFVYKHKKTAQYVTSRLQHPFSSDDYAQRVFRLCQESYSKLNFTKRPLTLYFKSSAEHSILAWTTSTFELYAIFDPLTTKTETIEAVLALLRWLKKEESKIFMLKAQTY